MISPRVCLLVLLLYHHLLPISAKDPIICHFQRPSIEVPSDCIGALNMIPNGARDLHVDTHRAGDGKKPKYIDLHFRSGTRNRKYLLPAAFRSGSCMILVRGVQLLWNTWLRQRVGAPRPPVNAASEMYFTVWPNVRKLANEIMQTCARKSNPNRVWGGMVRTSSFFGKSTDTDGGWRFRYTVTVRWMGNLKTTDGVQALLRSPQAVYNVYHADGGAPGGALGGASGVAAGK